MAALRAVHMMFKCPRQDVFPPRAVSLTARANAAVLLYITLLPDQIAIFHRSPAACMMASTASTGSLPQVISVSAQPAQSIKSRASSVSSC